MGYEEHVDNEDLKSLNMSSPSNSEELGDQELSRID